jgi:hypothetical protein
VTKMAELSFLGRALKAPNGGVALPKAGRAGAGPRSCRTVALPRLLVATEVASRKAYGGEARSRAGPLPRPQDLRGGRLQFPTLGAGDARLHLGQLDFLTAADNVALLDPPEPTRLLAIALGIRACLAPNGSPW